MKGTICLLVEMPKADSIKNRQSKFFFGWQLPAACTVWFGLVPPLLSERSLSRALLRGPECSMSDFMQYSIDALNYGTSRADIFVPLQVAVPVGGSGAGPYSWRDITLSQLQPLPFAHTALSMHIAWWQQAHYLLGLPSCPKPGSGTAAATHVELRVELVERTQRCLGEYLLACAQQMGRLRTLAVVLGVPTSMLRAEGEVEALAVQCRMAVRLLNLQPPLHEHNLTEFNSELQLTARASELLAEADALPVPDRSTTISYFLFTKTKRWMSFDKEELSKPAFQTELANSCELEPAQNYYQIMQSSQWARPYSFGIDPTQLLAAFVVLDARCPVDGQTITLQPGTGREDAHKTRAISADRIYGNFGMHSPTSCVFVAGESNMRRKDLLKG